MTIGQAALAWAVTKLGVTETGRNSGPEIDAWLAGVNCAPGLPWCCAFVVAALQEGAGSLGLPCPVPVTASSQRFWERAQRYVVADGIPQPGDVYVLQHGPSTGHVGIVEAVEPGDGAVVSEISGNTLNDRGGRAGNCVARHFGPPEETHGGRLLGLLRFA